MLYLKDWHLTKEYHEPQVYDVPDLFSDDWIDRYWEIRKNRSDDYRFVYMGTKGTWTPLHADVFRSYSWSINICGRKKWILFSPNDIDNLKDKYGNVMLDVNSDINPKNYPNFSKANPIICIQEPGETIFVPSSWWHQVENLEDTISINHNWANASNMTLLWSFLKDELKEVQLALSDCKETQSDKEWYYQCQEIMRMNTGMNVIDFCDMLSIVLDDQIIKLENFLLPVDLIRYNLGVIKSILEDVQQNDFINYLNQDISVNAIYEKLGKTNV